MKKRLIFIVPLVSLTLAAGAGIVLYFWTTGSNERFLQQRMETKWPSQTTVVNIHEYDWGLFAHIIVPQSYARQLADERKLTSPPSDNDTAFLRFATPTAPEKIPKGLQPDLRYFNNRQRFHTEFLIDLRTGDIWIFAHTPDFAGD